MIIAIPRMTAAEVKIQIRQMITSKRFAIDTIRRAEGDPALASIPSQDIINEYVSDISLLELMYSGAGEITPNALKTANNSGAHIA